ncbi:hypothetical protein JCM10908_002274 [Rhodotorula pacifica]|uniref:serine/threonine-protein kinase n=1 Tax=Rhodotorula pacifica TaxID=1495444 RepID=UPI00316F9509
MATRPTPASAPAQPLPDFRLAEKLGQGAFGSVYKALNWTTGETCAVKQIDLSHIPEADLPEIMSEIDLLKNLHHPNIVQYRGYHRTSHSLYIVLEYCENGSLAALVRKFGRIPESLVGLYVLQVLQGLQYLHEQGVIHRDIKGSNILATKEGSIKLADFGVATRVAGGTTSTTDQMAVVGSPYWMAPEIVDQSGATPSSDIWSLGALVIELLTSLPPYAFLDPLPALFRIVADDCPPLPEGCSAVVRDFLEQCFQKDPHLRVGAKRLLRHPWMVSARRQMERQREEMETRALLARGERNSLSVPTTAAASSLGRAQQPRRVTARRPPLVVGGAAGNLAGPAGGRGGGGTYEDEVAKVQEFNQALKNKATPLPTTAAPITGIRNGKSAKHSSASPTDENAPPPPSSSLPSGARSTGASSNGIDNNGNHRVGAALRPTQSRLPTSASQATESPQNSTTGEAEANQSGTSAWDGNFEGEGISLAVREMVRSSSSSSSSSASSWAEGKMEVEGGEEEGGGGSKKTDSLTIQPRRNLALVDGDGNATIRATPTKTPSTSALNLRSAGLFGGKVIREEAEDGEENYDDLVGDEKEEGVLQKRVREYQARARARPQLLRPSDLIGSLPVQLYPSSDPKSRLEAFAEEEEEWDDELIGDFEGKGVQATPMPARGAAAVAAAAGFLDEADLSPGLISSRFASPGRASQDPMTLLPCGEKQLSADTSRVQEDPDSDEEDPFAAVEAEESDDLGAIEDYDLDPELLVRDQLARQAAKVGELVEVLGRESWREAGSEGKKAALQLISLLEASEEARAAFVKAHGMLVVLEALRIAAQREQVAMLLRVANLVVGSDGTALEKLALVGGCPVITAFSSRRYAREIRLEAALFIGAMCRTSLLTLQMFVSAQGLRILVEMLDERYDKDRDLVWMAIDGLTRVFEVEGPTPRNDVCRVLVGEGVLDPLSIALLSLCTDDDELAVSARAKAVRILLTLSQSDHKVKEAIAQRRVISRLVSAVRLLDAESLVGVLKSIKNVSMVPTTLDTLQSAGVIEMLARVLATPASGKLAAELQNPAVNALFNLCRLSMTRQDVAATAGVIPLLQKIVLDNSPLKQFALPILCDFAHASRVCRRRLWAHDGIAFYLRLLKDAFWVNPALEAIAAWLQEETTRVEACLLEPPAVEALVRVVCKTRTAVFENLVEALHKLARCSTALAAQLAIQPGFMKRMVERIERSSRAVIRLGLLRLAKTLFDSLTRRPRDRDKAVQILSSPVKRLAEQEDGPVLVRELAKTLQDEFRLEREEQRRGFLRRAASISEDVSHLIGRLPPLPAPSPSPSLVTSSTSGGLVRSRSYRRR